jgi:hypothetical protein
MTDQPQDDPLPRHRRVKLELPDTTDLAAVEQAEIAVIRAAAEGRISSRVALDFTLMLDHRRRTVADREFESRMNAINQANRQRTLAELEKT